MSTYFVENFGCRATQADGTAIERELLHKGFTRATSADEASLVVLNTCTVTASADRDARGSIGRIHRNNPEAKILVTGCYAQRAPAEIAALPGVSWVVGNSHKHQVAEVGASAFTRRADFFPLEQLASTSVLVGDVFAHTQLMAAPVFDTQMAEERTRPNLKVQDGCNNRCSFCIIPSVRGRSRSLSLEEAVREVEQLVDLGYREVVLSGINLGRWGRDLRPQRRFIDLVRGIERTALEKLRLSSVEPMDWSDELIELMASSARIAKHVHAPLQSGSDRVLRRMHRKYRPWHYVERIEKTRAAMPYAAIGADVMVGFPGEGDTEFEETRALIEALPFTYLHVFTYSSRPGTPSAEMADQVPVHIARERSRVLRELAERKKRAFQESLVGQKLEAITLHRSDGERTECLTDNYQKLFIRGRHRPNQWMSVRVTGACAGELSGMAD